MSSNGNSKRLRVASYNIRKSRGLDQRFDPHRILSVINKLNADIIALQEADHRLGNRPAALDRDLVESETDFKVIPVARNDASIGWHGNAILVKDALPVRLVDHIAMPGMEPRGAVRVDFDFDGPFTLVATHLGLLRRDRRRQLVAVMENIDTVDHAVILGDFNEWSKSRGLEPLENRFEVHSPGRSFHAARPIAALDRVAATKALKVTDAGVEEGALARRASDHLPVWADLTWSVDNRRQLA